MRWFEFHVAPPNRLLGEKQRPVSRDVALLMCVPLPGSKLVRVYAKPKPPPQRSLGQIGREAYGEGDSYLTPWPIMLEREKERERRSALAVAEEVRRRVGEKFSLVGSSCLDIAWDNVIAEIKEGK